jgi:hypothetical protein
VSAKSDHSIDHHDRHPFSELRDKICTAINIDFPQFHSLRRDDCSEQLFGVIAQMAPGPGVEHDRKFPALHFSPSSMSIERALCFEKTRPIAKIR